MEGPTLSLNVKSHFAGGPEEGSTLPRTKIDPKAKSPNHDDLVLAVLAL
jgi:hypothetical protein